METDNNFLNGTATAFHGAEELKTSRVHEKGLNIYELKRFCLRIW